MLPAAGDGVSQQVALVQHELVLAWRRAGRWPRAGTICATFGISSSTWSRITLGQGWATGTGLAALVYAIIAGARRESRPPSTP